MSYASDTDDAEQCAQGEEFGQETKKDNFESFCEVHFGEPHLLSNSDLAHARWSYKQYLKGH